MQQLTQEIGTVGLANQTRKSVAAETCENVSWPAEGSQDDTFQTLRVWFEVATLLAQQAPDQAARGNSTSWSAASKPAGVGGVLNLASSPQEHCLPLPCCLLPAV